MHYWLDCCTPDRLTGWAFGESGPADVQAIRRFQRGIGAETTGHPTTGEADGNMTFMDADSAVLG